MDLPLFTIPDDSNVLNGIDSRKLNVVSGIVFAQHEITPSVFQVCTFRKANSVVFGVVLKAVVLNVTVERGRVSYSLR